MTKLASTAGRAAYGSSCLDCENVLPLTFTCHLNNENQNANINMNSLIDLAPS